MNRPFIFFSCVAIVHSALLPVASAEVTKVQTCFESGRLTQLPGSGNGPQYKLHPNGKTAILNSYDEPFIDVLNLETMEQLRIPKKASAAPEILKDGQITWTELAEGVELTDIHNVIRSMRTFVADPFTGKKTELPKNRVSFDRELQSIVDVKPQTLTLRSDKGAIRTVAITNKTKGIVAKYDEDPRAPLVTYSKKIKTLSIQPASGSAIHFKNELGITDYLEGSFSPNHAVLFVRDEVKNAEGKSVERFQFFDLKNRKKLDYQIPSGYRTPYKYDSSIGRAYSKDSRYLLLNSSSSSNDGVKKLDLETGKIITVSKIQLYDVIFNSSNRICGRGFNAGKSSYICIDSESGLPVRTIDIPIADASFDLSSPNSFTVRGSSSTGDEGKMYLFRPQLVCPDIVTSVQCDCLIPKQTEASSIGTVRELTLANACGKSFDSQDWKNLPGDNSQSIDESEALIWMKRFSKPGGFEDSKHTGILLGMIRADIHSKYPEQMKSALAGVVSSADLLFDSLLKKYPALGNLQGVADQSCLTDSEKNTMREKLLPWAKTRLRANRRPSWDSLAPYLSLAREYMNDEQKDSLAELVAERLVTTAGDSAELNQIFPSKIYKFAYNRAKKHLGLKFKDLTDVTVTRTADEFGFVELGLSAFDGAKANAVGFYIRDAGKQSVDNISFGRSVKALTWNYGDRRYSAEIAMNKQAFEKEVVTQAASPNYAAMEKEGGMSGVVIAGSNLGGKLTDGVMRNYIEYYTEQDFEFDEPRIGVDVEDYLKKRVSGAEPMHYLVKEAHSDGDEKNLFRMTKTAKILRGTRIVGGKKEFVDLVYPEEKASTVLLSNLDFGAWIKEREKKDRAELVYLNSSCWSKTKAVYEVSAAASAKLVNIPTTTSMTVFTNDEKNVMRAAIDGIRNQKSFAEIRTSMQKDEKYRNGVENVFIFPDQSEYKNLVTNVLRTPIDIDLKITVEDPPSATGAGRGTHGVPDSRRPYSIESER